MDTRIGGHMETNCPYQRTKRIPTVDPDDVEMVDFCDLEETICTVEPKDCDMLDRED